MQASTHTHTIHMDNIKFGSSLLETSFLGQNLCISAHVFDMNNSSIWVVKNVILQLKSKSSKLQPIPVKLEVMASMATNVNLHGYKSI